MDKLKEFEKKWPARSVGQINRYEAKHFLMDALADYKAELEKKQRIRELELGILMKKKVMKLMGDEIILKLLDTKMSKRDIERVEAAVLAILKETDE